MRNKSSFVRNIINLFSLVSNRLFFFTKKRVTIIRPIHTPEVDICSVDHSRRDCHLALKNHKQGFNCHTDKIRKGENLLPLCMKMPFCGWLVYRKSGVVV